MNKLDVLSKINPQMKAVLAKEDELAGDANDTSVGFEKMRENYVAGRAFWCEGGPVMAEKLDAEVDGPYGAIPVRYYYPTAAAAAGRAAGKPAMPAIVYVHGGGFVLGNLDTPVTASTASACPSPETPAARIWALRPRCTCARRKAQATS